MPCGLCPIVIWILALSLPGVHCCCFLYLELSASWCPWLQVCIKLVSLFWLPVGQCMYYASVVLHLKWINFRRWQHQRRGKSGSKPQSGETGDRWEQLREGKMALAGVTTGSHSVQGVPRNSSGLSALLLRCLTAQRSMDTHSRTLLRGKRNGVRRHRRCIRTPTNTYTDLEKGHAHKQNDRYKDRRSISWKT